MAFDMYRGSEKVCIETHEESLFVPVNGNPNYPCLDWLLADSIARLGSVRKVGMGRIAAMIGWGPAWQSATNSPMQPGI